MHKMSFHVVIVLYNKLLTCSLAIQNLKEMDIDLLHIIILDNSTERNICSKNKDLASKWGIAYYAMDGNIGLSKAYNFALDLLKENNKKDIVVWLDDDTNITEQYFVSLREKIETTDCEVFVPIIYGQDGVIYSPNEVGILKNTYLKDPISSIDYRKFNAINSCLSVKLEIYEDYRYDERLFMDSVDTKFFDYLRSKGTKFCILPISIQQNFFQRNPYLESNKTWNRFENRIKDTMVYGQDTFKFTLAGWIRGCGWGIVYGLKLKSVSFWVKCCTLSTYMFFTNVKHLMIDNIQKK